MELPIFYLYVLMIPQHLDPYNVGIAMSLAPPMKLMVEIPPIKMVMTGGWCKWHCYTNIRGVPSHF